MEKKTRTSSQKELTWVNQPSERTNLGRRESSRILRPDSGCVVGRAVDCRKEVDCVELFFSTDIQNQIVEETNRRITQYNDLHPNQKVEVNNWPYSVDGNHEISSQLDFFIKQKS